MERHQAGSEVAKIHARYARRGFESTEGWGQRWFTKCLKQERENRYRSILRQRFADMSKVRFLEIGAGGGGNLPFFHEEGIPWANIYANELREDVAESLKKRLPADVTVIPGNALDISESASSFDIVFVSTVFSSILDDSFRQALANHMLALVRSNGIILWYDFVFNNPSNSDVRRVTRTDVAKLFSAASGMSFYRVTLAPPIGRRLGFFYPVVNALFPFLRTHLIAEISR